MPFRPSLYLVVPLALLGASPAAAASDAAEDPLAPIVSETLAHHPELRFYEAEVAAAKAGRRSAGTWSDPELSVEVGHKRVRDASGAMAGDGVVWSATLTQTFEWPGRLALRKSIANRDVELAELGLAQFRAAVAGRTRLLAFRWIAAQHKAEAAAEVSRRYQRLRELFVSREPAGLTPQLETRVIEAQEIALKRRANEAQLAARAAHVELDQLRGGSTKTPLPAIDLKWHFGPVPATEELLVAAASHNVAFRVRQLELTQRSEQVSLARHEQRPALSLSPFVSQETAGERETIAGLGVSMPLPITGRSGAVVSAARARREQAEAALHAARLTLEREVLLAVAAYTSHCAALSEWQPDSVEQFRTSAALADEHYRLGAVPLATYTELQAAYLEAVDALLETHLDALAAALELQQLTGIDLLATPLPAKPAPVPPSQSNTSAHER